MIKQPTNWNEVQEFTERPKLPLGAYVCKVLNARVEANEYGEQLCLAFDIAEGEFAGFYKKEFAANTLPNKKHKGVLRIFLPKHDGSEKDEWTKSLLKGLVTSFEKSNPGYKWNWNEQSLIGRMIGILFRNEEWEYDGKHGWAVRPFRAISTESVRSGDYTLPKDKPLKNNTSGGYVDSYGGNYSGGYGEAYDGFATAPGSASDFAMLDDSDAQLPF